MGELSIPFLLRVLTDELSEKYGVYLGKGAKQRCHFLNHRTLGMMADGNGGVPYVMWGRGENWRPDDYLESKGTIFWVRTDELRLFVEKILPAIDRPIVLVTSEADYSPLHYDPRSAGILLESDLIAHWFCAQSDIPRDIEKHTPMPLGLPYPYRNDISYSRRFLNFELHRVVLHDLELFDVRLRALLDRRKPLAARKMRALADFANNNSSRAAPWGETRAQIHDQLWSNPLVDFLAAYALQFSLYEMYADYAFVVSPHGRGLDCFRTWEAILMGAIPIVKRSAIDPVFDGFPVVIVDSWSEITETNMVHWAERFADFWRDGEIDNRLSLQYWMDKIGGVLTAAGANPKLS